MSLYLLWTFCFRLVCNSYPIEDVLVLLRVGAMISQQVVYQLCITFTTVGFSGIHLTVDRSRFCIFYFQSVHILCNGIQLYVFPVIPICMITSRQSPHGTCALKFTHTQHRTCVLETHSRHTHAVTKIQLTRLLVQLSHTLASNQSIRWSAGPKMRVQMRTHKRQHARFIRCKSTHTHTHTQSTQHTRVRTHKRTRV